MNELNKQQRSAMQMQGRKRGICRQDTSAGPGSSRMRAGNQGMCQGPNARQGRQSNIPPIENATPGDTNFYTANLQMLKEQAQRMAKALLEIEKQINDLEQK